MTGVAFSTSRHWRDVSVNTWTLLAIRINRDAPVFLSWNLLRQARRAS